MATAVLYTKDSSVVSGKALRLETRLLVTDPAAAGSATEGTPIVVRRSPAEIEVGTQPARFTIPGYRLFDEKDGRWQRGGLIKFYDVN